MDNNIPPVEPAPASPPPPSPAPAPAPPAPAPEPAHPAAADVVVNSPPGEDTAKLRGELDEERRLRKQDQVKLSELEDENYRLKRANAPQPRPKKRSPGWTLLHRDED